METQIKTIANFRSISIIPVALVSPFQSVSVVTSSPSQPLALGWILAASADPQSPSCWTVSDRGSRKTKNIGQANLSIDL